MVRARFPSMELFAVKGIIVLNDNVLYVVNSLLSNVGKEN